MSSPTPNPFGNGIELRDGEPIWVVKYTDKSDSCPDGKVDLNPDATKILANIWEPVAIIAIVGAYRRGKSWFANVLHGRHDGFALGSSVDGCTKGIWMWSKPFLHGDMRVIVLDCEGLEDPNQDQDWAIKLFILCLTLSSTFIYNIPGVLGSGEVNKLYLMNDLQKFVQPPQNDNNFLPRLVVLLRDFFLEHTTEPSQYFMQTLIKVNKTAAEGIKKNFKDFHVYCLPHPGCKQKVLQHMQRAQNSDLDEDFVEAAANVTKDIYNKLTPKYINGRRMPGAAFSKFLEDIIETVNSPLVSLHLSIPDEYERTIRFIVQRAIQEGLNYYSTEMQQFAEDTPFPMSWETFEASHMKYFGEALKLFNDKIIGSLEQVSEMTADLEKQINAVAMQYRAQNSTALKEFAEGVAKTHWTPMIEERLKPGKEDTFKNHEELDAALEAFEETCANGIIPCEEALEVLNVYKSNHYPRAHENMKVLGLYDEQRAQASKIRNEMEVQVAEHTAEVKRMEREIETQKSEAQERQKIHEETVKKIQTDLEMQRHHNDEVLRVQLEAMDKQMQAQTAAMDKQMQAQNEVLKAHIHSLERQISNIPRDRPKCLVM